MVKQEKIIKNVNELILFLREKGINYLSPEGLAYIDGLQLAGYQFEFVSKESYDKLLSEHELLVKENKLLKLKLQKRVFSWF